MTNKSQTIFPTQLIVEVIDILKRKHVLFRRYKDFTIPRVATRAFPAINYILEFVCDKVRNDPGGVIPKIGTAFKALCVPFLPPERRRGVRWHPAAPITVILQHDADRRPSLTRAVMELERDAGVVSSAFYFYERHVWDDDHEPYTLDVDELQSLEAAGFEIGYHLNAYELADYDLDEAFALLERDISWFRERFDLRTFIPHGGTKGPGGINNSHIPYRPPLTGLTWAYNGGRRHGLVKDVTWSDGGAANRSVDDPREVAECASPGQRLLILMHPQYYGDELMDGWERMPIAGQDWWRRLWGV